MALYTAVVIKSSLHSTELLVLDHFKVFSLCLCYRMTAQCSPNGRSPSSAAGGLEPLVRLHAVFQIQWHKLGLVQLTRGGSQATQVEPVVSLAMVNDVAHQDGNHWKFIEEVTVMARSNHFLAGIPVIHDTILAISKHINHDHTLSNTAGCGTMTIATTEGLNFIPISHNRAEAPHIQLCIYWASSSRTTWNGTATWRPAWLVIIANTRPCLLLC